MIDAKIVSQSVKHRNTIFAQNREVPMPQMVAEMLVLVKRVNVSIRPFGASGGERRKRIEFKVKLTQDGVPEKRIHLKVERLHWYKPADPRSKMHVYQHPNPLDRKLGHSISLCGTVPVSTGKIGKQVQADQLIEDLCLNCLRNLRIEHIGEFEEVQSDG